MNNFTPYTAVSGQVVKGDVNAARVVDEILNYAIQNKASDIHIEPLDTRLRARMRIDGKLQTLRLLDLNMLSSVVSRIKVISGMDIAEKRLPQDGRLEYKFDGRLIDLRISTLPTVRGEKVVIRILDKASALLDINFLNFSADNFSKFKHLYTLPYGMVLVTGPTGSGKSTTLYAVLNSINAEDKNIITIEEPIEYKITGINQVAVNNKAGLTFAKGLRSIVRQDPNVIMIGEIRDTETTEIAVQSALTGHLVLSTLHTNSAVGAVTRLLDMGVEPYLLSNTLKGIVAQRLVRRLCPSCKVCKTVSAAEKTFLECCGDTCIYEPKGCTECNFTGYKGRIAIQEVVVLDDKLMELIMQRASEREMYSYLEKEQYKTMSDDGKSKILQGITSVQEVMEAVYCTWSSEND